MDFLLGDLLTGFGTHQEVTRSLLRLTFAMACGAVVGYEREHRGKAAGLRTHILVAAGCALGVIVAEDADLRVDGVSRIVQGLLTGIGFLGAGAILKHPDQPDIRGLTTAAGIWMTAAIGITAGLGRFGTAVAASGLTWCVLALAHRVEQRSERPAPVPGTTAHPRHAARQADGPPAVLLSKAPADTAIQRRDKS